MSTITAGTSLGKLVPRLYLKVINSSVFLRYQRKKLLSLTNCSYSATQSHYFCTENRNENNFHDLSVLRSTSKSSSSALKVKKISQAMKAYLERAHKHNEFLQQKSEEFEIGKRHLANMMGLDADTLTQDDIDKAIQYLLPSGLYEPKARPIMRPPGDIYPKVKAAQFDYSGRPFSPFFYTGKANFYEFLHNTVGKFHELDDFEDKMLRKGISGPPEESKLNLTGGDWLSIDHVQEIFLEKITEEDYNFFITTLTRLANHPYSFRVKDHIWEFRKDFIDVTTTADILPLMYDENHRPYMQMDGRFRMSAAKVTVWGEGTGKIKINGTDIRYFYRLQDREQIMFPLELSGLLGKVDVEATTQGGGPAGQAGAIRYAISMCLRSFISPETHDRMRLAGLLIADRRKKERKKPGQEGARRKYTWKKR